jgi:NAD(P)-dependent dehydrogenase (short-subunit alcohol dehydrogenase family)
MSAHRRRNKQLNLLGRVAVVTGASRGAGRAIAAVLGEHGATGREPSMTRLRKSRGAVGRVLRCGVITQLSTKKKLSSRESARNKGG